MKHKAVIQITAESYAEQQYIMAKFPSAVWVTLSEERTLFYVPYAEYNEVKKAINEWRANNE